MKLFALETTAHDYNQVPETVGVWKSKPDINALAQQMYEAPLTDLSDENIIAVVGVLRGEVIRTQDSDFQLVEIKTLD